MQAVYQFINPSAKFSSKDNGTYNLSMLPYAASPQPAGVADVNGLGVLPGYIGSFDLTVQDAPPDTTPPSAVLDAVQTPIGAGQPLYSFVVDYSDNVAIDTATLSGSNLMVTGPGGFNQFAQFAFLSSNSGTSVQAVYQIQAPNGVFLSSDSGTYSVALQPYLAVSPLGVADTSGNGAPAGVIGTFALQVPPAPNLVLSNVVYTPGTYTSGGVIAVRATITNTGNVTAAPFTISVGISPDPNFDEQNVIVLTTMAVNKSLPPGQSVTVNVSNAAIPATTQVGAYYFGAGINIADHRGNGGNGSDFASSSANIVVAAPVPTPAPAAIGGLNSGFGIGGIVRQHTGLTSTTAVAVQPDNKTVTVGEVDAGNGSHEFGVTRFNANGSIDNTFGGTGTVSMDLGGDDQPVGVVVQPNGKILVAGTSYGITAGGGSSFAMSRYNTDGSLDATFGNNGIVLTRLRRVVRCGPRHSPHGQRADPDRRPVQRRRRGIRFRPRPLQRQRQPRHHLRQRRHGVDKLPWR